MVCHGQSLLAGEPFGLLGQMAGDPLIKPLLDLGGQMKNLYGHGELLVHCPAPPVRLSGDAEQWRQTEYKVSH